MSKKTTLERAYLHINNGGLTFSIVERVDVRKGCTVYPPDWYSRDRTKDQLLGGEQYDAMVASLPKEDRYNRSWVMKIETYHFGSHTQFSFPIVPLSVKWMIAALQRVLARMEAPQALPTDGIQYPFEDKKNVHVTAQDGQSVDLYWPVPREPREDYPPKEKG